jgi:hypothetical protein
MAFLASLLALRHASDLAYSHALQRRFLPPRDRSQLGNREIGFVSMHFVHVRRSIPSPLTIPRAICLLLLSEEVPE